MNNFKQIAKEITVFGNNIAVAQPKALLTGEAANALIDKLVYSTPLANDHVLHELEAHYGAVLAQHIMGMMPKG